MPDSGLWINGDYGKLHMYILAQMSGDENLKSVLYNPDPKRQDIHRQTASMMFNVAEENISYEQRRDTKTVNYAVIYGGTIETLMQQMKTKDRERCGRLLDKWGKAYPSAWGWLQYAQKEALRTGWCLPTLYGRRIKLPDDESEKQLLNKAGNYPILGSDGEIIKRALILSDRRGLKVPQLAITVHDSISWDTKEEGKVYGLKEEIEMLPGFKVPFEMKSTFRWE
jgi:DNA polymerase-1